MQNNVLPYKNNRSVYPFLTREGRFIHGCNNFRIDFASNALYDFTKQTAKA